MFSEITLKAKEYIKTLLSPLESQWYLFHNLYHTLDVFQRVNYLIQKENINDDLAEILQLATLFHDSWCVVSYFWHEKYSIEQFQIFLRLFQINYPKDRIDILNNIILWTEVWVEPQSLLEKVLKDSDLDNLWRNDFMEKTEKLREETKIIQEIDYSLLQWYEKTLSLMQSIRYYTKTQILERGEKFKENMILLEQEIKRLKNV